jgi:hypothetical protein
MRLESWEFDVLRLYNPLRKGHLEVWFDFLSDKVAKIPGDIVEAGVFQGKSFLAASYLLQEVAPEKKIYGYDTFSGFPPVAVPEDDPSMFAVLAKERTISQEHINRVSRNLNHLRFLKNSENLDFSNVSSSGAFEETSKARIESLAAYLELTNTRVVEGPFEQTMVPEAEEPSTIAAAILDCDLHGSYLVALEFIWPRLSEGGIIYLDEYYSLKFPGARIAVDEFFESKTVEFNRVVDDFNGFERWFVTKTN